MSGAEVIWQTPPGTPHAVRLVYVPGQKPSKSVSSSADERYVVEVQTGYDAIGAAQWSVARFMGKSAKIDAIDALAVALGEAVRK